MLYPPDFETFDVSLSTGITIHGIRSPQSGEPLLLIHGYPQTHAIWHLVAKELAKEYTLVIPDLRGYGGSSKPPSLPDHANYAKSAMAGDMVGLMAELGHRSFYVCGHDRGGRVAHSLCVRHPEAVKRALILDISPTLAMYEATDMAFATGYFHWFFLIQPEPFPETLINAAGAEHFMRLYVRGRNADAQFHPEAIQAYIDAMRDPENVRGSCEDYRAAASIDCEEQREELEKGSKIKCDLRVLWGKDGMIERKFDCINDWKKVCDGQVSGEAVDCGHYIPEESPNEVIRHIREFCV